MDEKLKQRLVGAVVLVSLAVIFVPMILDERDREMGEMGSNLPPAPDFESRERIHPIELPPPLPEPESVQPEETAPEAARPLPTQPAPPASTAGPGTVSVPPSRERESGSSATPPEPVAAASAAPRQAAPKAPVPGWWVQVGSFGSEPNARGLAERLRKAGYSVRVLRAERGGRAFYRVQVGPQPDRAHAEGLKGKLDAFLGQKTIVLPPGKAQ